MYGANDSTQTTRDDSRRAEHGQRQAHQATVGRPAKTRKKRRRKSGKRRPATKSDDEPKRRSSSNAIGSRRIERTRATGRKKGVGSRGRIEGLPFFFSCFNSAMHWLKRSAWTPTRRPWRTTKSLHASNASSKRETLTWRRRDRWSRVCCSWETVFKRATRARCLSYLRENKGTATL